MISPLMYVGNAFYELWTDFLIKYFITLQTLSETTMQHEISGFLISRQWRDTDTGLLLRFWLHTDSGPLLIEQNAQEGIFFIEQKSLKAAHNLGKSLYVHTRPLKLKSFKQQTVTGFYFSSQRKLYKAAKSLKIANIEALESDIRTVDRYLMERFITGAMTVNYQHINSIDNFHHIENAKLKPCKFNPDFRVISFDIETDYLNNTLLSIAVYNEQTKLIFLLGNPSKLPNNTQCYEDERSLIYAFISWIQSYDPDLLIGWNCINFDLRFLENACIRLGLKFSLGRNNELIEWRSSSNSASASRSNEHYFVLVPGRAVLDGIDTLKSATYNFESFALDNVAHTVLGKRKLIEKTANKADEILRLYHEDTRAFVKYNLEDCILVWDIFKQTKLIEFATERARLTGLPLDKVGGSVAAFENQYLPRLHRQGYVAPNLPINPQGVGSPGGYVMESKPGFYSNILVLDFKSLYPSIIRSFKVDPYGLAEGDYLCKVEENTEIYDKSLFSQGKHGAYFKKSESILPTLIENLWQARDLAKANNNQAMSQAIKIIMNSFYGVMGTPGCRFFDARLPSSITLRGHEIMLRTRELIENEGFDVIYGDTDSIFVWIKQDITLKEADIIGKKLAKSITQWWKVFLSQEHQLQSALELEYETHFTRFLMPTIRGSQQGSKKRYAGLVCQEGFSFEKTEYTDNANKFKLVFKGLEAVRTDWTQMAREFQKELYHRIFMNLEYKPYILQQIEALKSGLYDDKLVYRKRLRQKLSDYQRNIPPHVQAARKADIFLIQQGKKSRYQNGGWIEYYYTLNGPEPKENLVSPLDYGLYIERQIEPIVDGIVTFFATSFNEITSKQMNLL